MLLIKILRIINSLAPEYGGPVAAAVSQTREMLRQGHTVDLLTLDAPTAPFLADIPGKVHALGPSIGKYCLNFRMINWLKQHACEYDLILVHGLWQFQSFGTWLASRQVKFSYFIFTHGMLNPWFKRTYPLKHLKKLMYWPAEYRVLRDAQGVLFTCEEERRLARESFSQYKAREIVADYGVQSPADDPQKSKKSFLDRFPNLKDKRRILFLGRIHPVKNCDSLIKAFAQVKDHDPLLHLVMAGPDQVGWMAELQELSRALGIEDRITWTGMLKDDLKWGAIRAAEVFVLPSHTENFGVVIAEALACSVPVLTTNKVNIWREVEQDSVGFVANDDLVGITSLLRTWLGLSESDRQQMKTNALASFSNRYEISITVSKLIDMLEDHNPNTGNKEEFVS